MTPTPPRYIADDAAVETLCEALGRSSRLAFDTEFVGEETFVPRLELVQVASEDQAAVIDVQAVSSLSSLKGILSAPHIEKVFHAGRQDLELLELHVGVQPSPIFDTQIAAAMVGYGTQIGYAQLVQKILGRAVVKAHTLTDWSKRPLTKEQIAYALADVEFLLAIHAHLTQRLTSLQRLDWAREEFQMLAAKRADPSNDPRMRYERIRGWEGLKPRSRAVLRELAAWREAEARRRNLPRGRIIRDDILVELARATPASKDALRAMRGLSPSAVDRYGEAVLAHIQKGLAVPDSEHPRVPKGPRPEPETAGRTDLLQAVLKACAQQASIAPTMLATSAELQSLIAAGARRDQLDLPLLKGWRRKLAGQIVLDVVEGKRSVKIDAQSGRVQIGETREE